MNVSGRFETTSHPDSTDHWRFSEAAIAQAVEQLPGKTVTVNYDPSRPVGTVIEAKRDDQGVEVVVSASDATPFGDAPTFGPSFRATKAAFHGAVREIDEIKLGDVGLLEDTL